MLTINMPRSYSLVPADVSTTGFASNVSGASWPLTATSSGDGLAHQVTIHNDSSNDKSGINITLVGTDQNGNALTEVVTGPGASATVTSTGYFLTLTSATPASTWGADTADIGWAATISSQWINLNWVSEDISSLVVDVTGTINFTLQQTFDPDFWRTGTVAHWVDVAASQTADGFWQTSAGATGVRLTTASYSSGAEIQMNVNASYLVKAPA